MDRRCVTKAAARQLFPTSCSPRRSLPHACSRRSREHHRLSPLATRQEQRNLPPARCSYKAPCAQRGPSHTVARLRYSRPVRPLQLPSRRRYGPASSRNHVTHSRQQAPCASAVDARCPQAQAQAHAQEQCAMHLRPRLRQPPAQRPARKPSSHGTTSSPSAGHGAELARPARASGQWQ